MGIRKNILTNAADRDNYIRGVLLLKQEKPVPSGLSTYDLFVRWHHEGAMHWGPAFLPWHRHFLMEFEKALQRVLAMPTFAIPYWPWHLDGNKTPAQQLQSPIWAANCMGKEGANGVVSTGPFAHSATNPNAFRVRLFGEFNGPLQTVNRGLRRKRGSPSGSIANAAKVKASIALSNYDMAPWFAAPVGAFRGNHERDHGMVHVWISSDMETSTSPNDPVFYLHHCNIDRIWEAWRKKHPASPYVPGNNAGAANLVGHRLGDRIASIMPNPPTISQLQNVSAKYTYDSLADLM